MFKHWNRLDEELALECLDQARSESAILREERRRRSGWLLLFPLLLWLFAKLALAIYFNASGEFELSETQQYASLTMIFFVLLAVIGAIEVAVATSNIRLLKLSAQLRSEGSLRQST